MAILGSLFAIGFALAFAAVAVLVVWGSWVTSQQELPREFISTPARSPIGRMLTIIGLWVPLIGAALLSFLAAIRIFQVAFGMG